jgi:hypothetical protein
MNHPAASDGVLIRKNFIRPKRRGIKPSSAAGGLMLKFLLQTGDFIKISADGPIELHIKRV